MKHTLDRVVASRGVTNGEKRMVNVSGKKRSGFFTGFPLPSQLKAKFGLLFLYDSRILLFLVALYLTVFAAFVSFECSTRRICTALADSLTGAEMDLDWSGSHSWTDMGEDTTVEGDSGATGADGGATGTVGGATGADGGAAEVNYEALGELLIAYDALETLRNRGKATGVVARVSRVQHSGRICPIVASGILAGVVLSVLLGAVFLMKDRKPLQATTPAPRSEGGMIGSLFRRTPCPSVVGGMLRDIFCRLVPVGGEETINQLVNTPSLWPGLSCSTSSDCRWCCALPDDTGKSAPGAVQVSSALWKPCLMVRLMSWALSKVCRTSLATH
ncbi:UNVERIFIED_CONTAM: Toxoplasma gondii family C protein [Hammondia hammondi]|eukprot:XP_008886053.1 Toxoplasma gondii family C protein [Hammondia hammondi]